MAGERGPFYKDKFCQAVTGHTDTELLDLVSRAYVDPTDRLMQAIGRDMPRTDSEKAVDRHLIFMSAQFQIPLLDIPVEEMCEAFGRFRNWEEYVHPRSDALWRNHEKYWGPTYKKLDEACGTGDEEGVKAGIVELVDKIIHD